MLLRLAGDFFRPAGDLIRPAGDLIRLAGDFFRPAGDFFRLAGDLIRLGIKVIPVRAPSCRRGCIVALSGRPILPCLLLTSFHY
jgi:hypothetical protein